MITGLYRSLLRVGKCGVFALAFFLLWGSPVKAATLSTTTYTSINDEITFTLNEDWGYIEVAAIFFDGDGIAQDDLIGIGATKQNTLSNIYGITSTSSILTIHTFEQDGWIGWLANCDQNQTPDCANNYNLNVYTISAWTPPPYDWAAYYEINTGSINRHYIKNVTDELCFTITQEQLDFTGGGGLDLFPTVLGQGLGEGGSGCQTNFTPPHGSLTLHPSITGLTTCFTLDANTMSYCAYPDNMPLVMTWNNYILPLDLYYGIAPLDCAGSTATSALCKIGNAAGNSTIGVTKTAFNYWPFLLVIGVIYGFVKYIEHRIKTAGRNKKEIEITDKTPVKRKIRHRITDRVHLIRHRIGHKLKKKTKDKDIDIFHNSRTSVFREVAKERPAFERKRAKRRGGSRKSRDFFDK